jgi:hypothetical protein
MARERDALATRNHRRVEWRTLLFVITGLDPVIYTSTVRRQITGSSPIGANLKGERPNPRVMAGPDPAINRRTCLDRWPGQARP